MKNKVIAAIISWIWAIPVFAYDVPPASVVREQCHTRHAKKQLREIDKAMRDVEKQLRKHCEATVYVEDSAAADSVETQLQNLGYKTDRSLDCNSEYFWVIKAWVGD